MNNAEYRDTLLSRLSNPQMSDQLSRLARRGSSKIASFVLPSLQEAIAADRPHNLLLLAVAGWARYLRGYDMKGHQFQIDDPESERLTTLANMDNADALLSHEMFAELRQVSNFTERFVEMVADIDKYGVIPTLRRALGDEARELVS